MTSINWVIFVLLWALTFVPCWVLMLKLIAFSASNRPVTPLITGQFIIYRLLIAAPYVYLLIVGADTLSAFVQAVIIGFLVTAFILSLLRMFFKDIILTLLWNMYGLVYDGLLDFYPYVKLQELMVEVSKPKNGERILDLGCGTGNTSIFLTAKAPKAQIDAVDSSRVMIRQITKKTIGMHNISIYQKDLMDFAMSAPSNHYSLIVLTNVLYTVQNRDMLWGNLLRILKPNGRIVVTNSDRAGSKVIIKEHLEHASWTSLVRPKFVIFVIDYFISQLSKTGQFTYVQEGQLIKEIKAAGGIYSYITRCYGGVKDGVNILFTVTKKT